MKLTKLIASTIALAIISSVAFADDGAEKKVRKKAKENLLRSVLKEQEKIAPKAQGLIALLRR